MLFRPLPRVPAAAAGLLAAGVMLAVASCGHVAPLGPDPAATMPQPQRLSSPLVLQDVRTQPPAPAGCPAGYVTLPGGASPGMCYATAGTRVTTIASAGVSPVVSFRPPAPPGQQAVPVQYGFWITVPAADVPGLTAVIPAASGSPGPPTASAVPANAAVPTISVAGRTWAFVGFSTRFTSREFEVFLSSKNQALQLQRILAAAG